MKELSIEKKAKRYDKAIERAEGLIDFCSDSELKTLEYVFPELKESKDEKIRKVIYGWIYTQPSQFFDSGFSKEEMLAWLEKQGEQKPVIEMKTPEESLGIDSNTYNKIVDECIYGEQKPANVEEVNFFDDFRKTDSEVGPKFHKGDWTVSNLDGKARQISEVHFDEYNSYYVVDGQSVNLEEYDRLHHLWTIQDAKDGDVLVNQNGEMPFIFKECKNNHIYCYCGYTNRKDIFFDRFVDSEGEELHWLNLYHEQAYPATKEQHNQLEKAMADAGYTFDFEKKELKKIEQKPAWTEEDERIIKRIKSLLYSINENDFEDIYAWLEFLKNRVLLQSKQEWSEEDERIYMSIMYSFAHNYPLTIQQQEFVKSLKYRVQPQQEWSKEDEVKINRIVAYLENLNVADNDILLKDVDWLKSLRPQNRWKPSDEQLNNILDVLSFDNCTPKRRELLESLYHDLKKLI